MQFQMGFPKQTGGICEYTAGNKSQSLAEGVFVDLFECALLKRTSSLVSERAA